MRHYVRSVLTVSYWRYALFSREAIAAFLAALGTLYLFVELADEFQIYSKDKHSKYGILILIIISLIYVISTRRPVTKVRYRVPKRDLTFEVRIENLFSITGETVISSNSTFDTDMSSGLISPNSLQGQFAIQFFGGQTVDIDRQLALSLEGEQSINNPKRPGKHKEYRIGTVARVQAHGRNFYFLAMSHMNESRTAYSDPKMLDEALERLWNNMAGKAELGDIVIPAIGTGRGRVALPRKKVVERIAQSFADASRDRTFSSRLVIVIRPEDADRFAVNLFEIRDYLMRSLHL